MRIERTKLGASLLTFQPSEDERGTFTRTYCRQEMAAAGINFQPVQTNFSRNIRKGTLRGLHYQAAPHEEAKLVHVLKGRIFDVIVDLRRNSATMHQWESFELISDCALFIPTGFAHGFQTLDDDVWIQYQMSKEFQPTATAGLRWDDPAFSIDWPIASPIVSKRDEAFLFLEAAGR